MLACLRGAGHPASDRATTAIRFALAGVAAAVALAGCTGQAGSQASDSASASAPASSDTASSARSTTASPTPADGSEDVAALIRRAGLDPCPKADPNATPRTDGLPDLALTCLGEPSEKVNLAKLRGTPMVVNVWGSWCPPCRAEAPVLNAVAAQAAGQVQFLGIDLQDEPARALGFAVASGMTYPSVEDPQGATKAKLLYAGPPVTYFVNPQGRITGRVNGQIQSEEALRAEIEKYLGVTVVPGGTGG